MNKKSGAVPVAVAAKVLGVDSQTVRLMLQQGLVDWGIAFKHPGSRHWSYMIWAESFYLKTGYRYKTEVNV